MKHKLISSATMPCNIKSPVAEKTAVDEKIRFTFFSFLVLLAGIPSAQSLNIVGELYITELILPVLAIVILFSGKSRIARQRIFWQFVITCLCLMLGYIISDIVAGTDSSKYLRAWGRNLLLFTDMVSLAIIVGSDKRLLWWFILGMAVGALVQLVLMGAPLTEWKIGYGRPIILLILLLSCFLSFRVTMLGLLVLASVSIFLDSRSMGAMCLVVTGIIFIRLKKPDGLKLSPSAIIKILIASSVVLTLLVILMTQTQDEYSERRDSSSTSRFTALRIGLVAISDSPVLGHGSWGEGTKKYADMFYKEMLAKMIELDRARTWERSTIFRPHSQLLQSWIEGGLFAAIFFMFFSYRLFIALKGIVLTRRLNYTTPLYSFMLVLSMWNVIMSPYGGNHRVPIAISIAIICILSMEKTTSIRKLT